MSFLNKIKDSNKTKSLKESIKNGIKTFKENKGFFGLLILIVTVKSSIIDWNYVPTGSMRPTLADGDQIIINKLALLLLIIIFDGTVPINCGLTVHCAPIYIILLSLFSGMSKSSIFTPDSCRKC